MLLYSQYSVNARLLCSLKACSVCMHDGNLMLCNDVIFCVFMFLCIGFVHAVSVDSC